VAKLRAIPGDLPDPSDEIIGCPFADRCPSVMRVCREIDPALIATEPDHATACHLYSETKVGTPV
jgi:oligopeptide/dipeptide ABC transporter ATP-binding protein